MKPIWIVAGDENGIRGVFRAFDTTNDAYRCDQSVDIIDGQVIITTLNDVYRVERGEVLFENVSLAQVASLPYLQQQWYNAMVEIMDERHDELRRLMLAYEQQQRSIHETYQRKLRERQRELLAQAEAVFNG